MTYSVGELIEMARALSQGDFDKEFRHHFQGEMGQLAAYIESLRQNLKFISSAADSSAYIIPQAASEVAEISQQAEIGVNSILEIVEEMLTDQEKVSDLLTRSGQGDAQTLDLSHLQKIAEKSRRSLMSLMSYLSFQDVIRQRAEKVQEMIEGVEKKILELLVKFKVKVNERVIKEGDGREVISEELKDFSEGIGLDQNLVDELLENLK